MNFTKLELKKAYRSFRDDFVKDFLKPVLSQSVLYQRAVGFFSSYALYSLR